MRLQEGPGKPPPVSTPCGPHPSRTPSLQEIKMQRISILQQLLRQEVEGLAGGQCAPLNGGSSLDMAELQPLLAEISRTLNAPESNNSGAFQPPRPLHPSAMPEPCLLEACGEEPEPCPEAEPGPPESCPRREPGISEPSTQEQLEVLEPCPPGAPRPLQACPLGQTRPAEPSPKVETERAPQSPESSLQPSCGQRAPATTSLTFSSQRPLCASPPIHSLQSLKPPTGQAGKGLVGSGCEQRRPLSFLGAGPALHWVDPCFLPQPGSPTEGGGSCTFSPGLLRGPGSWWGGG